MRSYVRILCMLLALVMVLSCGLVACGNKKPKENEGNDNEEPTEELPPEEYTKIPGHTMKGMHGYKLEPVEGLNLNNADFNILVPQSSGWVVSRDFATERSEKGADVIQDAAYNRVVALKDLYHVNVKAITATSSVVNEAKTDIEGQLGTYSLVLCPVTDIGSLSLDGNLCDLTEFDEEEITLEAPWYNQNFRSNMTIGGRLFYVIGDFSIIDNEGISVLQYNLDLFDEYGLDNPYTMVHNKKWTFDALHKLCKGYVNDFDGNGTIDQYDEFGFLTSSSNILFFMTSGGVRYAEKDGDDLPYLALSNSRTIEVLDKGLKLFADSTATAYFDDFKKDPAFTIYEAANKIFMENRALVRQCSMYRITQTRSMVSDFGILPLPMADTDQQEYYHMYSFASPAVAIPSYLKKEISYSAAAAVLEALSYYGRSILLTAYYDVVLKGRVARDDDSREMLDVIFDSSYFDIGCCNNFGGISYVFNSSGANKLNTFSSDYAAIKDVAEAKIEDYIDNWSKFLLKA